MFEKVEKGEKIHGQPRTCSHPINARTLTGVFQAVRTFSPCQFHVYVSIGTLESDFIISKYPMWNQMDISLFIRANTLKHCYSPALAAMHTDFFTKVKTILWPR